MNNLNGFQILQMVIAWQFIHIIPWDHNKLAWLNFLVYMGTPPGLDESIYKISFYTEAKNRRFHEITSPTNNQNSIVRKIKWYHSTMLKIRLCEKYSFRLHTWIHYTFKQSLPPPPPKKQKQNKEKPDKNNNPILLR